MALWEQLLLGVAGLLVLLFFAPGIKPMLEKSKKAQKDWAGLLLPISLVIGLVILLILTL